MNKFDNQTPSSLSTGSFARVNAAPATWLEQNKARVGRISVIAVAAILVIVAGSIWASNQAKAAQQAFDRAMDVYDAPLQQPGQPPMPNVTMYPTAAARAKVALPLFRDVAQKYGWFQSAKNAEYFAGVTAEDAGDTSSAEASLKKAADFHDNAVATLAKMALANLYLEDGKQTDAVKLYQSVIDHPSTTVSANAARLALASAEQANNPQGARELYAKIKDTDKTTVAGEIAAQKLSGK